MSECKRCGHEVRWVKEGKELRCLNPDGADHWDLCSALRWKRIVAAGGRFVQEFADGPVERISGYESQEFGRNLDQIDMRVIVGPDYRVSGLCKHCVPPWEVCPNGCPDAISTQILEVT